MGGQEAEGGQGQGELTELEWEEIDEGWGEDRGGEGQEGKDRGLGQASGPSKVTGPPIKAVPRGRSYMATPQDLGVLESQWEALTGLQTGGGGSAVRGGGNGGEGVDGLDQA